MAKAPNMIIPEITNVAHLMALMRPTAFYMGRLVYCAEMLYRAGRMTKGQYDQLRTDSQYNQADWDEAVADGPGLFPE